MRLLLMCLLRRIVLPVVYNGANKQECVGVCMCVFHQYLIYGISTVKNRSVLCGCFVQSDSFLLV